MLSHILMAVMCMQMAHVLHMYSCSSSAHNVMHSKHLSSSYMYSLTH